MPFNKLEFGSYEEAVVFQADEQTTSEQSYVGKVVIVRGEPRVQPNVFPNLTNFHPHLSPLPPEPSEI